MKLYDFQMAPNPRRVRIFLAEKGIEVPTQTIDMGAKEHFAEPYRAINPFQLVPALELDSGDVIFDSMAICRYFEEIHPGPALFGSSPLEKAQVEMWSRAIEFGLYRHATHAFRHGHPRMAEREIPQIAELAAAAPEKASKELKILDQALENHKYIAGDTFSVADITGLITLDFLKLARIGIPESLAHVRRWHSELSSRPSADA